MTDTRTAASGGAFTAADRGGDGSEATLRSVMDACPAGMLVTDMFGVIQAANAASGPLFGYPAGALVGRRIDILFPPPAQAALLAERLAVESADTARASEARKLTAVRSDGREFPVQVTLNRIAGEGGSFAVGIVDLREQQRMERLKDEFLATVSHELRTPLTSIGGALGLLAGDAGASLPAPIARLVKIAHANSQRLVRLVNGILDMEKLQSGKVVFALKRVNVRDAVERAIEANRSFAAPNGVGIRLGDAPAAAEIRADPDWIVRVVSNLLSNAVKFSPANGEVLVTITQTGETIRIAVRDHGQGVAAEHRAHVFEKFVTADNSDTRRTGGAGLGLAIVKTIVTQLGGAVGVAEAPGGGALFHVDLPSFEGIASPRGAADATARS